MQSDSMWRQGIGDCRSACQLIRGACKVCLSTACCCRWRVHRSVAASVDALLLGGQMPSELRWRGPGGELLLQFESVAAAQLALRTGSGSSDAS